MKLSGFSCVLINFVFLLPHPEGAIERPHRARVLLLHVPEDVEAVHQVPCRECAVPQGGAGCLKQEGPRCVSQCVPMRLLKILSYTRRMVQDVFVVL